MTSISCKILVHTSDSFLPNVLGKTLLQCDEQLY